MYGDRTRTRRNPPEVVIVNSHWVGDGGDGGGGR